MTRGKKIKRDPNEKITIRVRELDKIKEKVSNKAVDEALQVLTIFPLLALRDSEGFGKKRLLRFKAKFDETIQAYFEGYVTLEDVRQTLIDEVGIEINKGG